MGCSLDLSDAPWVAAELPSSLVCTPVPQQNEEGQDVRLLVLLGVFAPMEASVALKASSQKFLEAPLPL